MPGQRGHERARSCSGSGGKWAAQCRGSAGGVHGECRRAAESRVCGGQLHTVGLTGLGGV